jgi:uncharacterized protein YfiM (DUF2279 family)
MRPSPLRVLVLLLCLSVPGAARAQYGDEWFGPDKKKHFAACFVLAGVGYGGGALLFEEPAARWLTGAGLAMGAGVGKELYDKQRGGLFSLKDLAWDAVGTATGLGVSYLVDRLVFGRSASSSGDVAAWRRGGLGGWGASGLALDEPHQLLAVQARVHRHHGAAPAGAAAGDEDGDLAARALIHAAGGQHADVAAQAPLGQRALEPARQVHATAAGAPAQQALAADEHLHLSRSTAAFVLHPSSSGSRPRPSDAPVRGH